MPDSLTEIPNNAFYGCQSLKSIIVPPNATKNGYEAFANCTQMTYAVIPISVTTIGSYAFDNCSSFEKTYYRGNKTQWDSMSIFDNTVKEHVYFYSEQQPGEAGNYWHYVDGAPTIW